MADTPAEKTDAPVSVADAPEATTTDTKKTELSEPKTDGKFYYARAHRGGRAKSYGRLRDASFAHIFPVRGHA